MKTILEKNGIKVSILENKSLRIENLSKKKLRLIVQHRDDTRHQMIVEAGFFHPVQPTIFLVKTKNNEISRRRKIADR